jgi:predicted phosphoribosyltransferase
VRVLNDAVVAATGLRREHLDSLTEHEARELRRREHLYRGERPPLDVQDRTAIVVDDGLATGATMRAAVAALRRRDARAIVVAAPIGSPDTCARLGTLADAVCCVHAPQGFTAVGYWYEDFTATTDREVRDLLELAHASPRARPGEAEHA